MLDKIIWRLNFLFSNSWGKSWKTIWCTLGSVESRTGAGLAKVLAGENIITWNGKEKKISFADFIFFYLKNPPIMDFISLFFYDLPFVKKNFLENKIYSFEGPYEDEAVVLERGDYVIDVGANFGLFSILASAKIGSQGKVFAFEPLEEVRNIFNKNMAANKIANVIMAPFALGDNDENLKIKKFDEIGSSSAFFQGEFPEEEVSQTTLDKYCEANKIEKVDFLKADIEGWERNFLEGAEKTIKKFRPKISICIYHREDDPMVLEKIIKSYVPEYNIKKNKMKLFAWI